MDRKLRGHRADLELMLKREYSPSPPAGSRTPVSQPVASNCDSVSLAHNMEVYTY